MRQYKAFISYRHMPLDIAVASRLQRMIERYRVPAEFAARLNGRRLGYVFRDQDELPVSSDLSADIRQALDNSQFLIVVCTPDTPASIWVEREIRYFLQHHDRDHILAVLADGRPEQSFPGLLVHLYDAEGNVVGHTEPLAANIADPGSDRRRVLRRLDREAIRIYAALVGCPYDALYKRERRYRNRRMAVAGGTALALALAYIALLSVKNAQISRQNEVLVEQKRSIQLSQSRLLAQDAAQALESGDRAGALRASLEALPRDGEDPRPYCAAAESVLLDAAGVYGIGARGLPLIDGRSVDLAAPVHAAAFSASGERVYALDDYGNLFAVDAMSGGVLWQTAVIRNGLNTFGYLELRLYEAKGCAIVASSYEVVCLSLEDGGERWRYVKDLVAFDALALDEENDLVGFIDSDMSAGGGDAFSSGRDYALVVLRADSGEVLRRVTILEGVDSLGLISTNAYGAEQIQNALFTDGGKAFMGFYCEYYNNRTDFFFVDIESGEARQLRAESAGYESSVFYLDVLPGGDALIALQRSGEDDVAFEVTKIGLSDGEVVARTPSPREEGSPFIDGQLEFHTLRGETRLYVSVGKYLYVVDLEACEVVASTLCRDVITSLGWLDNNVFGYTLADGYYAAGWLSPENRLYDTRRYGVQYELGANTRAMLGGGGFIAPDVDDGRIDGVMCGSPKEGFGYVLTVPEDASHELRILRLLEDLALPQAEALDFPDGDYWLSTVSKVPGVGLHGDRLLLFESRSTESGSECRSIALDAQTHEQIGRADFEVPFTQDLWLFSDASGALNVVPYSGAIARMDFAGGGSADLTPYTEMVMSRDGEMEWVDAAASAAAGYLSADGRLLAAWCDGERMRWWLDGEEQPSVAMPRDLTWRVANKVQFIDVLAVAPCGVILLSDFGEDQTGARMAGFAGYDIAQGRWLRAEDAAHGSAERLLAGGEALPRLAVLDADATARVYDLEAGELLREIPTGLPLDYVKQMQFILDDRWLLLHTEDDRLFVYSVESGECVYRGDLQSYFDQPLSASLDSEGRRVVLIYPESGEGIVLDLEGWTELARLKDARCFDPKRDLLYVSAHADGRTRLMYGRIPALEELTGIVREVVELETSP